MQFCSNLGLIKIQTIGKFQNNVLNLIFRYLNWARYFLYIDIYINVTIKAYDVLSIYLPMYLIYISPWGTVTNYVIHFTFIFLQSAEFTMPIAVHFPLQVLASDVAYFHLIYIFWWIGFLLMLASQSVCSHVCRNAWKFCKIDHLKII